MIEQGSELRSSTLKRAPDHCVLSSSDPVLSSNMVAVLENIFPLGLGQRWGIRLAKVLPRAARVGEQHTCARHCVGLGCPRGSSGRTNDCPLLQGGAPTEPPSID